MTYFLPDILAGVVHLHIYVCVLESGLSYWVKSAELVDPGWVSLIVDHFGCVFLSSVETVSSVLVGEPAVIVGYFDAVEIVFAVVQLVASVDTVVAAVTVVIVGFVVVTVVYVVVAIAAVTVAVAVSVANVVAVVPVD